MCGSIGDQYMQELGFGVNDPETKLAEFNEQLYAAGLQKIIDEKQAQYDAWIASNNP